jgi:hypothetical protein
MKLERPHTNSDVAERGQAIVEAALILPILFFIVFGILWFGRVMNVYSTLYRAAHDAAQAYASNTCGSCGNGVTTQTTVMTNVVSPILAAARVKGTVTPTFNTIQLNPGSTPIEIATTVDLSYTYPFTLYGMTCCPLRLTTLLNGITITGHGQARQEN